MGVRGPAGKHPDARHGHGAQADRRYDEVTPAGVLEWPEPGPDWPEPLCRWYRALRAAGQAVHLQQTDVEHGWIAVENLSRAMNQPFPVPAATMAAFEAAASNLLVTAGARRRVHLEIARHDEHATAHQAAVASLADRRRGPV